MLRFMTEFDLIQILKLLRAEHSAPAEPGCAVRSPVYKHTIPTGFVARPRSFCKKTRSFRLAVQSSLALLLVLLSMTFSVADRSRASNLSSTTSKNQADDAEMSALRAGLQTKLKALHEAGSFPGATLGFVLADGRSGSVSAGMADVENNKPLKPTDRMLAGSIGKTYVSAVMLQLVQDGKVNLDTKIDRWFGSDAWFPRLPNAKDISLRMLMNHSSGIPEHVLNADFIAAMKKDPDRVWKPEELIAYILDAKPLFPAGKGWSYADTNYILVGMIFERVTKKTVYGEVEKRILKPFRLDQTIPSDRRVLPGLITGYSTPNSPFGFEGRVIVDGKFIINPQMEWTGGGFASTAEDLARWAKLLFEGKVFGKDALEQMLNGVEAKEGRGSGAGNKYGLAVQIRQSEWGVSYGHGGWFPGYLSEMEYFPSYKIAVAVQFNTDAGSALKKGPRAYIADAMRVILGELEKKRAA